jgi:hypothetical protein
VRAPFGGSGRSALDLARELLAHTGGLQALAAACPAGLVWSGIGPAKRATLLAVAELTCRLAAAAVPDRAPLERPEAVVRYLDLRYGQRHQEIVGALYLDARNRLMTECELYRGTVSRASTDNLTRLKDLGLTDVAFSKRRGLAVSDMARSPWIYRRLRNFRAGIERWPPSRIPRSRARGAHPALRRVGSRSPDHVDVVGGDLGIGGQDRHALFLGLGHQHAVERVAMT